MRCPVSSKSLNRLLPMITVVIIVLVANGFLHYFRFPGRALASESLDLQPMTLTLVAQNGTVITLDETEIANLPSIRDAGGYRKQTGTIVGPDNYTGVAMTTLVELVGGINSSNSIMVTASDNYTTIYTYDHVVEGNFTTFDPSTGEEVPSTQPLTLIVAYFKNDLNLTTSDGTLKVAIVGPEGLATSSTYWAKYVVKIEVVDAAIPEYPTLLLTALFVMLLTFSTAIISKRVRILSPESGR